MVNLFNYTENEIHDIVNGTQIVIPPRSHTQTSEKKANEMCERYRGQVGLKPKADYAQADYDRVKELKKRELVAFAQKLMSGERPNPSEFKAEESKPQNQGQNQEQNNADAQA